MLPRIFRRPLAASTSAPPGQTTPAPCNSTLAVTFNITADTTIGAIQVVTQGITGLDFSLASGSTCTGAISAGNSCYVNVNFTPLAPGLRLGAVNLFDSSGNLVATAPISGVGQAPEAAFGPGVQTTLPVTGLHYNVGMAVDAAGDVFIADNVSGGGKDHARWRSDHGAGERFKCPNRCGGGWSRRCLHRGPQPPECGRGYTQRRADCGGQRIELPDRHSA